jgi:RNA polymerase sigma factor (sigma-70 family)
MNELAAEFERLVWEAPPGPTAIPPQLQRIAPTAGGLLGVLKRQSDETLALALQHDVYVREVSAELIYERFRHRLCQWFRGFGADEHTAFDLVHDLFIHVYKARDGKTRLSGYDPKSSFEAYLRVIARNLCISRFHRRKRPEVTGLELERPGSDLTAETVYRDEMADQMTAAISRLPEPGRSAMRLRLEDYPTAEIAAQLKTPVEQIYRVLHLARKTLLGELKSNLPASRRGRPRKKPIAESTE